MINRGKIRKFQEEQLVRVLGGEYKLYGFGLNRAGEVVYIGGHSYLTLAEVSRIIEMGHTLQQAVELKHITISELGPAEITKRRLKRADYLSNLETVADDWFGNAPDRGVMET